MTVAASAQLLACVVLGLAVLPAQCFVRKEGAVATAATQPATAGSDEEPPEESLALRADGQGGAAAVEQAAAAPALWTMPMWLERVPLIWKGGVYAFKTLYAGELYVGAPAKKFTFLFDTGSGNTVIPGVECKSVGCMGKQLYNPAASTTSAEVPIRLAKFPGDRIHIRYGETDVDGMFGRDRICLDEAGRDCVTYNVVRSHSQGTSPFALFSIDGVLGLGLASLSASEDFNFVQQVMAQHPGMLRWFSIYLAPEGYESTVTLGGYDESLALEKPRWVSVVNPGAGYWQVSVQSLTVEGVGLDFCADGTCRAVTDLGSSHFMVPPEVKMQVLDLLVKPVPQSFDETFDCPAHFSTSTVDIGMGGFTIRLPAKEMLFRHPFWVTYDNGTEGLACFPNVHSMSFPPPLGPKLFILGHPLHRTYYTIFDWGDHRIGLALADQNSTVTKLAPRKGLVPPVYLRDPETLDFYLPHITGPEPEMEERLREFGGQLTLANFSDNGMLLGQTA